MPKAHTLVDSFGDNTIDTTKWSAYGGAQEVNQRVEIQLPSNTANAYAGFTSASTYDLTDSQVVVELVRALRHGAGSETYLYLRNAAGDRIYYKVQDGLFYASKAPAGAPSSTRLAEQPYDPARHRWMRIREQLGILSFDYSRDGRDWELLVSVATPFSLSSVRIEIAAGTFQPSPAPGLVVFDNFNTPQTSPPRRVEERRLSARDVRVQAAELASERRHDAHANNNDEVNYLGTPLVGNYSKSLRHDTLGDPIPASYASLLRALESRDPGDFEEIILAAGMPVKLTNPQSGLTFDIEGPDPQEVTMPPAPRFDSQVAAHEEGELYWMAVLRDLPFVSYGADPTAAAAINSLNGEFPQFGGTAPVTAQNLFRGIYPGEQVGPYVSQFLLKGNQDKRKPAGQGRDATDGFISYGSRTIDQRLFSATAGVDYLADFPWWLDVQNGVDKRGLDTFDTVKRFTWNLRAGATFVHFDQVIDAWYNAAWILMSEPTGNQLSGSTARPQIDLEFPKDQGNPYDPPGTAMDSRTQSPFATFGPPHLLQALSEVLGRALRAVWWQKWGVHRRLRPEEYGGRVHNQVLYNLSGGAQGRTYPLHASITASLQTGGLAPYFGNAGERFPNAYLLPQAYPEGAPTHPAYGAGHAAGSAACATILKAFFDESVVIESPVQANATGTALVTYTPPVGEPPMTVGGELNKLAGNIALFRNAAGVHWRSDYTESLPFGEAIAIGLLQEMSLGFNEDDAFFELTKFDGQKIRIFDGKVEAVMV
jgi:hypothetical protein